MNTAEPQIALQRYIRKEVALSTVMNGLVPATAVFFTFTALPIGPWGAGGYAVFALKMIFVVAFGMTLIMTWVTRMRSRRGRLPLVRAPSGASWVRYVPKALLVRALSFALLALAGLGTLDLLFAWLERVNEFDRMGFTLFVFSVGAVLGFVMTGPILLAALDDASGE